MNDSNRTIIGFLFALAIICFTIFAINADIRDTENRALEQGYEQVPIYPGSAQWNWKKAD